MADQPQYLSQSGTLNPSTAGEISVPCPAGTRVVGGGVFMSGSTVASAVRSTAPLDGADRNKAPDDGWIGAGNPGPLSETLTTYAICTTRKLTYATSRKPVRVASGDEGISAPRCPKGSLAISGGVKTPNPVVLPSTNISLLYTAPVHDNTGSLTRRWLSIVFNNTTQAFKFKAWAICSKRSGSYRDSIGSNPGTFMPGDQDSLQTPTPCSIGDSHYVAGLGAYAFAAPHGTEIASIRPVDTDADTIRDDAVQVYMNNETASNQQIVAEVVCISYD